MLKKFIVELSPQSEVITIAGDILDEATVDALIHCDLVIGCTDSIYARAALGDISTQYVVPVIDLAVQMRAEDGVLLEQVAEIARYAPGFPCPWCRNRVSATAIRTETLPDEEVARLRAEAAAANLRGQDGNQY